MNLINKIIKPFDDLTLKYVKEWGILVEFEIIGNPKLNSKNGYFYYECEFLNLILRFNEEKKIVMIKYSDTFKLLLRLHKFNNINI